MATLRSSRELIASDADDEADDEEDEGYDEEDAGFVDLLPFDSQSRSMRRQLVNGTRAFPGPLHDMTPPSLLGQRFYTPQGRAILRSQSWDEAWCGRSAKQVADKSCSLKLAGMRCPFCTQRSSNSTDIFERTAPEPRAQKSRRQKKGKLIPKVVDKCQQDLKGDVKTALKKGLCAKERFEKTTATRSSPFQKSRAFHGVTAVPPRDKAFVSIAKAEAASAPELAMPPDNSHSGSNYLMQRFLCNIEEEAAIYGSFNQGNHQSPTATGTKEETAVVPIPPEPSPRKHASNEPQKPKTGGSSCPRPTTTRSGKTAKLGRQSDESKEQPAEVAVPSKGRRSRQRRTRSRDANFLSTCHVFRSDFLGPDNKHPAKGILETTAAKGYGPARFSSSCDFEIPMPAPTDEIRIRHAWKLLPLSGQTTGRGNAYSWHEMPELCSQQKEDTNHAPGARKRSEGSFKRCSACIVPIATTALCRGKSNILTSSDRKVNGMNSVRLSCSNPELLNTQERGEAPSTIEVSAQGQAHLSMPTASKSTVFVQCNTDGQDSTFSSKLYEQAGQAPKTLRNAFFPERDALTLCRSNLRLADVARSTKFTQAEITEIATDDQNEGHYYNRNKFLRNRAIFDDAENRHLARSATSGHKKISAPKLANAEAMPTDTRRPRLGLPGHGIAMARVPGTVLKPKHNSGEQGHQSNENALDEEAEATPQRPVYSVIYQAEKKTKKKKDADSLSWPKCARSSEEIPSLIAKPGNVMSSARRFEQKAGPAAGLTAGKIHPSCFQLGPAVCSNLTPHPFPRRKVYALDLEEYFSTRCKFPDSRPLTSTVLGPSGVMSKSGTAQCVDPHANTGPKKVQSSVSSERFGAAAARPAIRYANAIGHRALQLMSCPRPFGQALPWAREPENRKSGQYKGLDTDATAPCIATVAVQGHRVTSVQNSGASAFERHHQSGRPGAVGPLREAALARPKYPVEFQWVECKRPSRRQAVMLNQDVETTKEKPMRGKCAEAGSANSPKQKRNVKRADGTAGRQSTALTDPTALVHLPLGQTDAGYNEARLVEGEDTEVSSILEAEIKNAAVPISACKATKAGAQAECLHHKSNLMTYGGKIQADNSWNVRGIQGESEDNKVLFRPIVVEK